MLSEDHSSLRESPPSEQPDDVSPPIANSPPAGLDKPLVLSSDLQIWPPVVLAPMAGVTNYPYRKICDSLGAGLCVSEMVSSRGILEGHRGTWRLAHFGEEERPRSIQIFGCVPDHMGEAAKKLRDELDVDHIDINFGCPVHKVTKKGMGAAAPKDRENCRKVVRAVVEAVAPLPVTIKVRLGIDEDDFTFYDAGKIAQEEGCRWITVHGRTAKQMYSGQADWNRIAELKQQLSIPVLGNGDIFKAEDAVTRMKESGVDGVVIGRGCLGNPWLFRDLKAAFEGRPIPERPSHKDVAATVWEHFQLLREHFCTSDRDAILRMRKFGTWYASGFYGAAEFRRRFQKIESASDLKQILELWVSEELCSPKGASEST